MHIRKIIMVLALAAAKPPFRSLRLHPLAGAAASPVAAQAAAYQNPYLAMQQAQQAYGMLIV